MNGVAVKYRMSSSSMNGVVVVVLYEWCYCSSSSSMNGVVVKYCSSSSCTNGVAVKYHILAVV